MASGPITSWQIDRETMEAVRDLSFLGSRITVDGDCKYEIKRHLLLGRKALTNLNSMLKKQRENKMVEKHVEHISLLGYIRTKSSRKVILMVLYVGACMHAKSL